MGAKSLPVTGGFPARAIENLAYTVGVNRVGDDGNGVPYNGHSIVVGPKGEDIFSAGESETISTVKLQTRSSLKISYT